MALTVRPDDEVYQFDTVWLGPDEYTLPIQARYVAWGTWLACFLVAAVVLIPIGGSGPAAVFGSLIWALGLSVVLSRAVMLVVDHERPLRSLPALFSAEARAALQARRRAERSLLIRPGKIRVRETPPKVLAMRERQRGRTAAKADRRQAPVEAPVPVEVVVEPDWTPEAIGYAQPAPGWSIPTDVGYDAEADTYTPVPVTYGAAYPATPHLTAPEPELVPVAGRHAAHEAALPVVAGPRPPAAPRHRTPQPAAAQHATGPNGTPHDGPHGATQNGHHGAPQNGHNGATQNGHHGAPQNGHNGAGQNGAGHNGAAQAGPVRPVAQPAFAPRPNPFRTDPHLPDDQPAAYRGPVTVSPTDGRHARAARDETADGRAGTDGQAAIEARILLPARKDR